MFFSFSRNYLGFSVHFNSALFISCQIITTESGQGALYCTGKILQYSGENHNHQSASLWQALCDGGKEKIPFKRKEHLANWLGRRWGRGWKRKEKRTGRQDKTRSNEVRRQVNGMRQCYTKTREWKKIEWWRCAVYVTVYHSVETNKLRLLFSFNRATDLFSRPNNDRVMN